MAGTSSQPKCQSSNAPMKSPIRPWRFQSRSACRGVSISATQLTSWFPAPSTLSLMGYATILPVLSQPALVMVAPVRNGDR